MFSSNFSLGRYSFSRGMFSLEHYIMSWFSSWRKKLDQMVGKVSRGNIFLLLSIPPRKLRNHSRIPVLSTFSLSPCCSWARGKGGAGLFFWGNLTLLCFCHSISPLSLYPVIWAGVMACLVPLTVMLLKVLWVCVQAANEILIRDTSLETLDLGGFLRIKMRGTSEKSRGWRDLGGLMGQCEPRWAGAGLCFLLCGEHFPINHGGFW